MPVAGRPEPNGLRRTGETVKQGSGGVNSGVLVVVEVGVRHTTGEARLAVDALGGVGVSGDRKAWLSGEGSSNPAGGSGSYI